MLTTHNTYPRLERSAKVDVVEDGLVLGVVKADLVQLQYGRGQRLRLREPQHHLHLLFNGLQFGPEEIRGYLLQFIAKYRNNYAERKLGIWELIIQTLVVHI